ncbi:hypothetical protein [Halosolutus gelatinilyticus]|uniref:hypothetical protein n=1 Tax=Halosolutus gelatinilyticus TaxID=2931975 RepID=UPI001FF5E878|nr:hypothetical protein [Halosolutus gelatinilyticus]
MDRITRRRVLGCVGIGALAGCLDGEPTSGSTDDTDGNGADRGGNENGDGADRDDRPPASCPDYGDHVDRVVCYGDAADEPVVLEPSADTIELGEEITFTLSNGADERLNTNFYNWRVDKHVDGDWYHVAPLAYNEPLMFIDPGDRHAWTLTPTNDGIEAVDSVGWAGGTEDLSLRGLGGGHYAFRARGWFEGSRSEAILAFAATFALDAEPLTLTPTDAIEETTWEGETLVARSTRGEPNDENYRLGAYELETVAEPSTEPRSMITEQVVRRNRLRDAIALAVEHDASAVRLEEYNATHPIFGHDTDAVYEYQGSYYRVSTRELED